MPDIPAPATPDLSGVAAVLGEPTRGRMLASLMDGRARTATELALDGGVAPSTASSHLARLTGARLITVTRQGRHRYFQLASREVATALEGLMRLAGRPGAPARRTGPADPLLRRARVCYDHLAGEAGVALLARLRQKQYLAAEDTLALTESGQAWCGRMGIDLAALRATRRRLCRPCLDWSERRMHLAGALGSALLDRLFSLRYARRRPDSRAVVLSPRGEVFLERLEPVR